MHPSSLIEQMRCVTTTANNIIVHDYEKALDCCLVERARHVSLSFSWGNGRVLLLKFLPIKSLSKSLKLDSSHPNLYLWTNTNHITTSNKDPSSKTCLQRRKSHYHIPIYWLTMLTAACTETYRMCQVPMQLMAQPRRPTTRTQRLHRMEPLALTIL